MKKEITLTDILIERARKEERYFKNYLYYAKKIKKITQKILGKVKIFVFGSVLRRNEIPRDIDILIVSPKLKNWETKRELHLEIMKEIGRENPFEFHFVSEKEYKEWYRYFIKEKIKV